MNKPTSYLHNLTALLEAIATDEEKELEAAATAFAKTLETDHRIFLFGTGHSHMLAEELFYRAGGLVQIHPVLETALMLHESASKSTEMERLPHYADVLFESYGMEKDDLIVIISNSGRNGVCVDLALKAKAEGMTVIALTNLNHSKASLSRHPSGKKLFELADIVLDNKGCIGDASIPFEDIGRNVAPTSTSTGAAILNAVVAGCAERMLADGYTPEVFASSNIDGGDKINNEYVRKYRGIIRFL